MRAFWRSCVALAVLLLPSALSAQSFTTKDLRENCAGVAGGEKSPTVIACLSYVGGFRDGYIADVADVVAKAGGRNVEGRHSVCIPDDATNSQLAAVFVKWANEHPEDWNRTAVGGLFRAFLETWKCK